MFFNFVMDKKMGNENKTKIFNQRFTWLPEVDKLYKKNNHLIEDTIPNQYAL